MLELLGIHLNYLKSFDNNASNFMSNHFKTNLPVSVFVSTQQEQYNNACQDHGNRRWFDCSDSGFARLQTNHLNVFCGLLAAVLYSDTDWLKLFKDKAEIHHLRQMASLPTTTVIAKWFVFDARARLSAASLVSGSVLEVVILSISRLKMSTKS